MNQRQLRQCTRQSHPSKQHLQYICLQQFCFGKTRLVCNKCLKRYHFGHKFLPLRESMDMPLSQQQVIHQKKIQLVLSNQLAALPQLHEQVVNSVKLKIGKAIQMLHQEVLKIKNMVSKEKLLKQAISYLKYQGSQSLNDEQVNQKVDFIVRMSEQSFQEKMKEQQQIVNELGYKITKLKENISYFLSGFDQKLSDIKAIIQNKLQMSQKQPVKSKTLKQKLENKEDQKMDQMNEPMDVQGQKFRKKDVLKSKIKLKSSKIKREAVQLLEKRMEAKMQPDMLKRQSLQDCMIPENDNINLFFNNPLQKQLEEHFQILQLQRNRNKNIYVRSLIIEFDGIRAFAPKFLFTNVPYVLSKLKILRINMYESCKAETFERIVKNFRELQELTITEVESYSDQIIDIIVQRNPYLRKFYNFFNLRDNFQSFVSSRHFKHPPYQTKLTIKQLAKLSELKYLQNIHIDQCHRQEAVQILQRLQCLKEVTLGTFTTKRYIKKQLLNALSKKRELIAVSFLNLVIIFDECNSKQVFNWIKGPRRNLTTIYMHNFERLTDKSIYLLSKQCNIEHLFLEKTSAVKGKSLGSLVSLKSLIIEQSKIDAASLKQSGFTELTSLQTLEMHVNIPCCYLEKFHKLKHLLIYYKDTIKTWNDRNKEVFQSIDKNFFKNLPNLQTFIHNYWLKLEQFMIILQQCPNLKKFCIQGLYYAQNQDSSRPISNFPMPLLIGTNPKSEQLEKLHNKQFRTIVPLIKKLTHLAISFTDPVNAFYVDKMNQVQVSKIIDKQILQTLKNVNFLALNNLPDKLSVFEQIIIKYRLLLRIKFPLSQQKEKQVKQSKLPIETTRIQDRRQSNV